MRTLIVKDSLDIEFPYEVFDLSKTAVKDCLGCLSCWKPFAPAKK